MHIVQYCYKTLVCSRYARLNKMLAFCPLVQNLRYRPDASEGGGHGTPRPPSVLADQLTLSQQGGTLCPPHYYVPPPPGFSDLATALR